MSNVAAGKICHAKIVIENEIRTLQEKLDEFDAVKPLKRTIKILS